MYISAFLDADWSIAFQVSFFESKMCPNFILNVLYAHRSSAVRQELQHLDALRVIIGRNVGRPQQSQYHQAQN